MLQSLKGGIGAAFGLSPGARRPASGRAVPLREGASTRYRAALSVACKLLLVALMLNAFAVRAQVTEIVASGLWNYTFSGANCNFTEQGTIDWTYANGAYSATQHTSNSIYTSNSSGDYCQSRGEYTCSDTGYYLAGQDLLTTSQFQALLDRGPNCGSGDNSGRDNFLVTFTSPDSISVTGINSHGTGFSVQMTRAGSTATTAIVASGSWNVVIPDRNCNSATQATFDVTYANGAYSVTAHTANSIGDNCQSEGPQSCAATAFYLSGQDLLSTERFLAGANAMLASCGGYGGVQSVSFTSPDSVSGTSQTNSGQGSFQMTRAGSTPTSYALTVTNAGTGYGSVASSPAGISCYMPKPGVYYLVASDCTESYPIGTGVTLSATADTGSTFAGWGGACSGKGSCAVSMDSAKGVSATFNVASSSGATCTLSANPASIRPGESSLLTADCSPAATSYVWSGACAGSTGATCAVSPLTTTTYTVTGSNASGSATARATVTPFSVQRVVLENTVRAVVNYNSTDANKIGNVFVFGTLPSGSALFGSATKSAAANGNGERAGTLVPAVLTASGWQQVIGGSSLSPIYSGALNSSTNSFALYAAGLFDQSQEAGVMCVTYTTSSAASFTDQGLPVVQGNDPSVSCPAVTLANNPQAGIWWNTAEGGRGFVIEARGASLFFGGFLYESSGRATWVAAAGAINGNSFSSTLDTYANGQTLTGPYVAPVRTGNAGNISIAFTDTSQGTLTWPGGTIPIQRFDIVTGGAAMTPPAGTPEGGIWWNPNESGRGFALEIQGGTMFMGGYMFDASGNPVWYSSGQTPMTDAMTYIGTWEQYGNGQTLTGTYTPAAKVNTNVGSISIRFTDTQNATLTLPDGRTIPITRFRF